MPNASFDTRQSRQTLSSANGPTGMQTRIAIVGGRSDKNCIQARQFQPSWDNTAKRLSYWKMSLLMFQKKIMCLSHMNKAYLYWDSIMFKKKLTKTGNYEKTKARVKDVPGWIHLQSELCRCLCSWTCYLLHFCHCAFAQLAWCQCFI